MAAKGRAGELKSGRLRAGLTQAEAASRLGLSQPYVSQLECGRRRLTAKVALAMKRLYGLPATSLPLPPEPPKRGAGERLPAQLAALGYPGYAHVQASSPLNPAVVLLEALSEDELDARVTEALPWVLARYPGLNWEWLTSHARLRNLQNRLGFLVTVARELVEGNPDRSEAAKRLSEVEKDLERSRLAAETTLSRESMPQAEREWLRANRPANAERWNVLTTLKSQDLPYAA